MGVEIKGTGSSNLASVDANNALKVATSATSANNGIMAHTLRADPGVNLGTILDIDPEADQDYRSRVAQDSILFRETWAGAALNSTLWTSVVTTMTTAVSAGFLVLNNGSSVAASAVARVQSYQTFNVVQSLPLTIRFPLRISAASIGIAQTGWSVGLGIASGITASTDGIEIAMSTAGVLTLQSFYNNSAANSVSVTLATPLAVNTVYDVQIVIGAVDVQLWINNLLAATLSCPASVPTFALSPSLPFYARIFNSASGAATATQLLLGKVTITQGGISNQLTFHESALYSGGASAQGQSGATLGTTARAVAAGTAPTGAVPTNTTAALGSGLGGDFLHTNTLAVNTYGIISSYQVPALALGSHNKALHITGVRIDTTVQAVLANAGAANYIWGIAFGHTAVSLATAEAATTKAPRIVVVGQQVAIGAAAAGTQLATIQADLNIIVHPGEFIQAIVKNGGTVGTGGSLYHTIYFTGKWI